jgi:hypothetical protein
MNRIRSILLIVAIAAPSLASAETASFESTAAILGASCGADIDANCRGVNLDSVRLKDCLTRNQDSMSAQCKADYIGAFDAIQKRVAARAAVPKLCLREAVKVCGASPKEASKALGCLLSAPKGISVACSRAIGEAGYR